MIDHDKMYEFLMKMKYFMREIQDENNLSKATKMNASLLETCLHEMTTGEEKE